MVWSSLFETGLSVDGFCAAIDVADPGAALLAFAWSEFRDDGVDGCDMGADHHIPIIFRSAVGWMILGRPCGEQPVAPMFCLT